MWKLLRPDAINILESNNIKKALPNYRRILMKENKAKFHRINLKEKIEKAYKIL